MNRRAFFRAIAQAALAAVGDVAVGTFHSWGPDGSVVVRLFEGPNQGER